MRDVENNGAGPNGQGGDGQEQGKGNANGKRKGRGGRTEPMINGDTVALGGGAQGGAGGTGTGAVSLDGEGFRLLCVAAREGHARAVEILLENSVPVNGTVTRRTPGWTPLHLAAINGHSSMMSVLLAAGGGPNLPTTDGRTALHCAVTGVATRQSAETMICALLDGGGAAPRARDRNRQSTVHSAARYDHPAVVRRMHSAGVPLMEIDRWHRTPLQWAVLNGNVDVVGVLLELGAAASPKQVKLGYHLKSTSLFYESPLHVAVRRCLVKAVEAAVARGGTGDKSGDGTRKGAAERGVGFGNGDGGNGGESNCAARGAGEGGSSDDGGDAMCVDPVESPVDGVRGGGAGVRDLNGSADKGAATAIAHATNHGTADNVNCSAAGVAWLVLQLLLDAGADVGSLDQAGQTPLQMMPLFGESLVQQEEAANRVACGAAVGAVVDKIRLAFEAALEVEGEGVGGGEEVEGSAAKKPRPS